jgi:SAM-dependent methyltransferase
MRELDMQIDYWNVIGPTKPFAHPINLEQFSNWVGPSSRILDFGCGYGRALGILQSDGYTNLIGVDPAPAMIASAREHFPSIQFEVIHDFRNIGLPSASVDAVLLISVLMCVPTDEGQRAIVSEIARILRPRGILYISDMWLQTDERNVVRYRRDEKKYGIYGIFDLSEGVTVRHHERRWMETLLGGFEMLALDEIQVQTMNGNPATAFQWFGRLR